MYGKDSMPIFTMEIFKSIFRALLTKDKSERQKLQIKEQDLKDLEFLAQKSSYFIEKQVESYRNKIAISATVITVIVIFIPFFISGLQNSALWIKLVSILPLAGLTICLVNFVKVLKTKSLDFGFHTDKFDSLVNKKYEEILLYEIGANKSSFEDNSIKIKKIDRVFHFNIKFTLVNIIASTIILIITNLFSMSNNENETNQPAEPVRVVPTVDPGERTNLTDTAPKMHLVVPDSSGKKTEQK